MHATRFTDGNAGILSLGAAIGAAVIFGAGAFAPAQPKPQPAQYEVGLQRANAMAQWGGAVWGRSAPAVMPAELQVRRLSAPPQVDITTPAPRVFGTLPVQKVPLDGVMLAVQQADTTQIQPRIFGTVPLPKVPLTGSLFAQPQYDPSQTAAVVFHIQPAPFFAPTPLVGILQGVPQTDPTQIQASIFRQPPLTDTPYDRTLISPPQADPTQVPARVFGTLPVQKTPLTGAIVAAPQTDPTQIAAVTLRAPPPSAAPSGPPPLRGVLFAMGQSPELLQGANWAQPETFAPAQPTPTTPYLSITRDVRAFEGFSDLFGQFIFPPPPTMPGADVLPPLVQQGAELQPLMAWVANRYPFTQAAPVVPPLKGVITTVVVDSSQAQPLVFGTDPLTDTPYDRTLFVQPQVDPTQPAARVFGTLPLPPVPLRPIPQAYQQENTAQIGPIIFSAPPAPAAGAAPALRGALVVPPQADPSQPAAVTFRQPPLTDTPYDRTLIVQPQVDVSQPAARLFGQVPLPATPLHPTMQAAPQESTAQIPAQLFAFPPPTALTPPQLRAMPQAAPQFDPSLPTTVVFSQAPLGPTKVGQRVEYHEGTATIFPAATSLPTVDLCPILLAEAYARIAELEAELEECRKHHGDGGGASGDGDDIDHGHHHRRQAARNEDDEQRRILDKNEADKKARIAQNNALIMAIAAATVHGFKGPKGPT